MTTSRTIVVVTLTCMALGACGLPSDGRVRPAPALSDGPTAHAASFLCTDGTWEPSYSMCQPPRETRKQVREALAREVIRIRTESQGK